MEVACGQCLGCRSDRTRMWAMRIVHEAHMHKDSHGSCFLTLTYRDKADCTDKQFDNGYHVPDDYSLNYHHFRDFIKRLRKAYSKRTIRYFHCGEYGDETLRPHYHAAIFNYEPADTIVYRQTEGITTFESPELERLWPYGFCTTGTLEYNSAAYVSGYILKKITGLQAQDVYLRNWPDGRAYWVKPPYTTMSLKPGIGANFYEKYKSDFFPSDESPIPGYGTIKSVPRFYTDRLQHESPEIYELVKELRLQFISAHGADFTPERLMDKYNCARAKQHLRQRNQL